MYVPNNCEHHAFDARHAQVLGWLVSLVFQHVFHNEYNVLYKLCVGLVDDHLTRVIKEFFHQRFDLVKQNGIKSWSHFVAYQLLNVLLNLSTEFFVRT